MHIQRCLSWFRKQKQAEGPKMMRSVVQKPLALNMLQLAVTLIKNARWGHRSIYCNSGVTHRVRVLQTNWPVLYVISFSSGAEAIHPTSQRSLGWEEGPRRHGACQRGPREQAGRVCPKKLICQLHLALWTQDPYHHGWTTGEWPSFDSFFFFLSMTLSPLLSVLQHHKHTFWPSYFIMLVIGTLDDSVYWLDIFMQSTVSNLF